MSPYLRGVFDGVQLVLIAFIVVVVLRLIWRG